MNSLDLTLNGPAACKPGQTLSGQVRWRCEKEPRAILLKLSYHSEGRGTCDEETLLEKRLCPPRPADHWPREGGCEFSLDLPANMLPSYRGKLIALEWQLHASADLAWAFDPESSLTLVIGSTEHALRPPFALRAP